VWPKRASKFSGVIWVYCSAAGVCRTRLPVSVEVSNLKGIRSRKRCRFGSTVVKLEFHNKSLSHQYANGDCSKAQVASASLASPRRRQPPLEEKMGKSATSGSESYVGGYWPSQQADNKIIGPRRRGYPAGDVVERSQERRCLSISKRSQLLQT
jgi:hypothetical protein